MTVSKKALKSSSIFSGNVVSSTTAKNNFGELLEFTRSSPLKIEKNGRAVAVMVSNEEFERLTAIADSYLAKEAAKALKGGTLGIKESKAKLAKWLDAKD